MREEEQEEEAEEEVIGVRNSTAQHSTAQHGRVLSSLTSAHPTTALLLSQISAPDAIGPDCLMQGWL